MWPCDAAAQLQQFDQLTRSRFHRLGGKLLRSLPRHNKGSVAGGDGQKSDGDGTNSAPRLAPERIRGPGRDAICGLGSPALTALVPNLAGGGGAVRGPSRATPGSDRASGDRTVVREPSPGEPRRESLGGGDGQLGGGQSAPLPGVGPAQGATEG
jgi:hypothetical protein